MRHLRWKYFVNIAHIHQWLGRSAVESNICRNTCGLWLFISWHYPYSNVSWTNVGPTSVLSSQRWINVSPTYLTVLALKKYIKTRNHVTFQVWCRSLCLCITFTAHSQYSINAVAIKTLSPLRLWLFAWVVNSRNVFAVLTLRRAGAH